MRKIVLYTIALLILVYPSATLAKVKVPILVYHSIAEYKGHGSKELFVTPENFEKQMNYLKKNGFTLLTFERWKDINKVNKPIFITFDDGYKNNLNAYEIFRKLKDKRFQPVGTLFVISDYIGTQNRLTNEELKRMGDSGLFSIQSHTAIHADLTKINHYEAELKGSKEKIEKITGKPVIALAYPFGNFNNQVANETKKYYRFGLTTTPGPYVETGMENELYFLPRIYIKNSTTLEEFANIVKGS
ncbi:MAG TPA: polysaccharide deacetylase family protein [Pseudoneobacillus sp.]|nr:polysaccharide deacetylase family protein [Pseudoneobacillus sp.]